MVEVEQAGQRTVTVAKVQKDVNRNLQPNPFTTYRDPETGRWIVVKISVA